MGHAATSQRMTAAEYLAWEREQPDKHEFHLGEIFAMAGASTRHNFLSASMVGLLHAAVRGGKCRVFSSDQQISAARDKRYVYADAVVVCGKIQIEPGTTDVLANPTVIVEVLSPSTETYDRGGKWEAYQRLPSLSDYLLVSQTAVQVEHFQREADGSWRYRLLEAGAIITLSNGAKVAVDDVYEGAFELTDD